MISRRTLSTGLAAAACTPRGAASGGQRFGREVLAFYYGWYGTPERSGRWRHWAASGSAGGQHGAVHQPLLGHYDSHDPQVVARHAAWARQASLTGFISSWWGAGTFEDQGLATLGEALGRQGLKLSAYIEGEPSDLETVQRDLRRLIAVADARPNWLRVEGRPVFFIYADALNKTPLSVWRAVADEVASPERRPFLVPDLKMSDEPALRRLAPFLDGVHRYITATAVANGSPEAATVWARKAYPAWRRAVGEKLFCLTVFPGFDDRGVQGRPAPRPLVERYDGAMFSALWEEAIRAGPDWVLLTSWNEWHEGSEIEPSREHGDLYLQINAAFARRFLSEGMGPPS